jgi:zinc/manganese transport system ATP-binding protein
MGDRVSPLIKLDNVTLGYERHPAVHHVTGSFARGSLTAVVGPNGAGKSTLLKALAGLLRPLEGAIVVHGIDRSRTSYLPQQVDTDPDFPISVLDVVMLGAWRQIGSFKAVGKDLRARALEVLDAVGLVGFEHRMIGSLSAGQRQKALFARTALADSELVLLDEPFTAMDARTVDDLLAMLHRWHAEGRTIVAVIHDYDQVRRHFPDTLLLARDAIAWGPTRDVLTSANLLKAAAVSEAWDRSAPLCERVDA